MDNDNLSAWFLSIRNSIFEGFSNIGFIEWGWILLASLISISFWAFLCRKSNFIKVFKNSSGEVTVTRKALQELVYNTAINLSGVDWVKAKVNQTRNGLSILVELKIEDTENLTDISEKLQNKLTELVTIKLGIEKIKTIDVHVSAIESKNIQPRSNSSADSF